MPPPKLTGKSQTRERPTYEEMFWENLQETKTEVRETRKELNARMDRIERRMDNLEEKIDKLDEKINETRKELVDKIDDLHNGKTFLIRRINIDEISFSIIALAVIYAVLK